MGRARVAVKNQHGIQPWQECDWLFFVGDLLECSTSLGRLVGFATETQMLLSCSHVGAPACICERSERSRKGGQHRVLPACISASGTEGSRASHQAGTVGDHCMKPLWEHGSLPLQYQPDLLPTNSSSTSFHHNQFLLCSIKNPVW
jgi:hypothetical protein